MNKSKEALAVQAYIEQSIKRNGGEPTVSAMSLALTMLSGNALPM